MKQISDKYTIAWFKLAECVARGEKERALGVYRLLSHSFEDDALAEQLAGDLFLAFHDTQSATEKYAEAAKQYMRRKQILEAAAVHEHLITLHPENGKYRLTLIDLYKQLKSSSKVQHHIQVLFVQMIQQNKLDNAAQLAEQLEKEADPIIVATMHEQLLFALIQERQVPHDIAMLRIQKIINAWAQVLEEPKVEQLLAKIKTFDEELYELALEYYTKIK